MAVVVPFESLEKPSIDPLVDLVSADMERVNSVILARTGSEVTMIPEVANHLISSGGKRLRPMLTLAMAQLTGYGATATSRCWNDRAGWSQSKSQSIFLSGYDARIFPAATRT